jgi:PIN domain nuclease of toxin-antitoxin system
MIILDTHVGVWWVHDDARLPEPQREYPHVQVQP